MSIDDYLDDLYARLPRDPRTARRTLDEAADHLHTAADDLQARGFDRETAEAEAVRRFGPAAPLVRAATRRSLRTLAAEGARTAVLLTGFGLVAVGASGGVVAVLNALFGPTFVGGPPLPTSDLRTPNVYSLSALATAEEVAGDAVSLRLLAGAVGALLLVAAWMVHRRRPLRVLPSRTVTVLAAAAFGGAALVLAAASLAQWAQFGAAGVGYFLSAAVVAGGCAVVAVVRAARVIIER